MKGWGVESGWPFARPHADLPVGNTLSPSSPSSGPEPLELGERRRRGTDRPCSSRTFSEAWEQSWEVAVLWGQAGSQGLVLGPTPWLAGAGFSASLPPGPRQAASEAPAVGLRRGQAGPKQPPLPGPGWEAEEVGAAPQVRARLQGAAGAGV